MPGISEQALREIEQTLEQGMRPRPFDPGNVRHEGFKLTPNVDDDERSARRLQHVRRSTPITCASPWSVTTCRCTGRR
jgi:hypothetical protein